jgi:MFS transporter, ACS family, tartrate transporter
VLLLGLVYFGNAAANYGLGFWLPTIVKGFGVSNLQTGSLPRSSSGRSQWCCGRLSDRMQERKWNTALAFLLTAAALAASTWFPDATGGFCAGLLAVSILPFLSFILVSRAWPQPGPRTRRGACRVSHQNAGCCGSAIQRHDQRKRLVRL